MFSILDFEGKASSNPLALSICDILSWSFLRQVLIVVAS